MVQKLSIICRRCITHWAWCVRSAFAAPHSHPSPSGTMARRAASHLQKEALMSHIPQPNHKHEAHGTNTPRMGTWTKDQRRTQLLSDCHVKDAPTSSTWNLREDLVAGLTAAMQTHACHFNFLASHPDSSNVGMPPLQTGLFAFAHSGGLPSLRNSYTWPILATGGMGLPNITLVRKSKNKIRVTSSFVSYIWMHHVKLILIKRCLNNTVHCSSLL